MLEAYTEKARRCVFFGHYEAIVSGAMEVSLEHFLLGLLREVPEVVEAWAPGISATEILNLTPTVEHPGEFVPKPEELPLSAAVRRALSLADSESVQLEHEFIGCKHILLGIAQVKGTIAARILAEHGFNLERARGETARAALAWDEVASIRQSLQVKEWAESFHWEQQPCSPRDALICADDQRPFFFRGQPFDPSRFLLVRESWTYFHCAICWTDLYPTGGAPREDCFTNGSDWLCAECYERLCRHQKSLIEDGDY